MVKPGEGAGRSEHLLRSLGYRLVVESIRAGSASQVAKQRVDHRYANRTGPSRNGTGVIDRAEGDAESRAGNGDSGVEVTERRLEAGFGGRGVTRIVGGVGSAPVAPYLVELLKHR